MQAEGNVKNVKTIKTKNEVLACKYSADKKFIASGSTDGSVSLFPIKSTTNEPTLVLRDKETDNVNNTVTAITHHPNNFTKNVLTVSYSGGLIKNWDCETGALNYTIQEKRQTFGVIYHPSLNKMLTLGDDGNIMLYDEETKKIEQMYTPSVRRQLDGHASRVFSACFNPTSHYDFCSGGWDSTVQFWDLRQNYSTRYLSNIFIGGDGLTVNRSGVELLTCAYQRDNPLQVWNYGSGSLLQILKPDIYECLAYCGKFMNKNFAVSGGTDLNLVRVVDMRSFSTVSSVRGLPGGVYCLDYKNSAPKKEQSSALKSLDDLAALPNVIFCSGKNIYEISFR